MSSPAVKRVLPRVLIFGQAFNRTHGGGITLTNLFKGWDKDKIAVAATGHVMYNLTTELCENYYQLGFKEFKWWFPFSLIQRKFPSGKLKIDSEPEPEQKAEKRGKNRKDLLRNVLVNNLFYPALEWFGLFHAIAKIRMSPDFSEWLSDYKPELLYFQVSSRDTVLFAQVLCDHLNIPGVIHMMDDWPSTISRYGLFKKYWQKRIDKELRAMLDRMDLFLSISDAMSVEYMRRYGKKFKAFHNPIDIKRYILTERKKAGNDGVFRILYLGRIGIANKKSIYHFSKVISTLKTDKYRVTFDVYTSDTDSQVLKKISGFQNIIINSAVKNEEVPVLLQTFDLLLLPLDFSRDGIRFARYSMPTKASEYMISGKPVLVYSPSETAVSGFFSENKCGFCVNEQDPDTLINAVRLLAENEELREELGSRARRIAEEIFDAERVRREFARLLMITAGKKPHSAEQENLPSDEGEIRIQ